MAKFCLKPLEDRVVVEPKEAESVTAGGIVLPDNAKEKQQRGTVVAVGPGKLLEDGTRAELSVVVGDEVIYGKYAGNDITVDGKDVKILREEDILAKAIK
ncbi:MAG: co-chaperone GroES [Victivallales bacterium]|nr:co-chaperone GroES [Victivallales bacterium]MBR5162313.1 co-chaperone GroES [Thermoguttaceae bacterium]